jgi:hypothetical protein
MNKKLYVVYNLRETYHEQGDFQFKIVLSPKHFRNGHDSSVVVTNADGTPLNVVVEKWGRKINCSFSINDNVPDGVSTIKMSLRDSRGKLHEERERFWVIK